MLLARRQYSIVDAVISENDRGHQEVVCSFDNAFDFSIYQSEFCSGLLIRNDLADQHKVTKVADFATLDGSRVLFSLDDMLAPDKTQFLELSQGTLFNLFLAPNFLSAINDKSETTVYIGSSDAFRFHIDHIEKRLTNSPHLKVIVLWIADTATNFAVVDYLSKLKDIHMDRFSSFCLSEDNLDGFTVNRRQLSIFVENFLRNIVVFTGHELTCSNFVIVGDGSLIDEIGSKLLSIGIAKEAIEFGFVQDELNVTTSTNTGKSAEVFFDGFRFHIPIRWNDKSLLDNIVAADLKVPFSCKEGNCGSCRARLVSGEVRHLSKKTRQAGVGKNILTCQVACVSEQLSVEYSSR